MVVSEIVSRIPRSRRSRWAATRRHFGKELGGKLGGGAESDDGWHVFGAPPPPALLGAADEERAHAQSAAGEESCGAFGAVEFVAGESHGVDGQVGEVHGYLAGGLDAVDVKGDAGFATERSDFLDGEDDAGFVVDPEHRDERDVAREFFGKLAKVENAVCVDGDAIDFDPLLLELVAELGRGGMFDGAGDDALARARAAKRDWIAVLIPSVPVEVKMISESAQPMRWATWARASSMALRARCPKRWTLEGLP